MAERAQFVDPITGRPEGDRISPSAICPPVPSQRDIGVHGLLGAGFRDPLGMAFATQLKDMAEAKAKERFPALGTGSTARDAFRHFYGASTLARLVGPQRARNILNAVEVSGGNGAADQTMDTWNNHVAVTMGHDPRYRRMSVEDIFDIALKSGCLKVNK